MSTVAAPSADRDSRERSEPVGRVWLSHHYHCDLDRVARVGGVHVCRRCLAIACGLVPALVLLTSPWRPGLQIADIAVVGGATIAAAVDFLAVVTGRTDYDARRVWLLGPAVGATMAYLAVSAAVDGFGLLHVAAAVVATALLAVLARRGEVVRRS